MDEIEAFIDERRADRWFQNRSQVVDRLESVLKSYLAGEGAEWRGIWREVKAIIGRRTDTPVERWQTLAFVLPREAEVPRSSLAPMRSQPPGVGTRSNRPSRNSSVGRTQMCRVSTSR
jgi:hypothetical protein